MHSNCTCLQEVKGESSLRLIGFNMPNKRAVCYDWLLLLFYIAFNKSSKQRKGGHLSKYCFHLTCKHIQFNEKHRQIWILYYLVHLRGEKCDCFHASVFGRILPQRRRGTLCEEQCPDCSSISRKMSKEQVSKCSSLFQRLQIMWYRIRRSLQYNTVVFLLGTKCVLR